jgi:outer membrane immunogenic protein
MPNYFSRSSSISALVIAGALLAGGGTHAADLGAPQTYDAVSDYDYEPSYRWRGLYFGVNLGYLWSKVDMEEASGETTTSLGRANPMGAALGVHLGALQQVGSLVYGGELVAQKGHSEDSGHCMSANSQTGTDPVAARCRAAIEWSGLAVGKVGLARDNMLLFVSAGLAVETVSTRLQTSEGTDISDSNVRAGLAYGAGISYMLSPQQLLTIEYDHLDFRSTKQQFSWAADGGNSGTMNARPTSDEVRVSWSLKLGH